MPVTFLPYIYYIDAPSSRENTEHCFCMFLHEVVIILCVHVCKRKPYRESYVGFKFKLYQSYGLCKDDDSSMRITAATYSSKKKACRFNVLRTVDFTSSN
jgi:hypothetical protein